MGDIVRSKRLLETLVTGRGKLVMVAAASILFEVVFFTFYPAVGLSIAIVGIIPALVCTWFYGMWAGILFTLGLYLLDTLAIILMGWGEPRVAILPESLLGLATCGIASLIVGRLGENERKHREEFHQRQQLMEERNSHSRFLHLLNDILLAAMETDDMSSMLKVLVTRTGELFKADHCFITFWDEKERKAIPMAAYGPSSEEFFTQAGCFEPNKRGLTAAVMDEGRGIAIEDFKSPGLPVSVEPAEQAGNRAALALPLVSGERNLGALILAYHEPHYFSENETWHGEMAAKEISLAVMKVVLLEEAQQSVHELAGLHDISQAFSLHGDSRRTYGLLAETIAGLIGAKMCMISLYNPAANELQGQEPSFGLEGKKFPPFRYSADKGLRVWDFSASGPLKANTEDEIPAEFRPFARGVGAESVLAVPMWDSESHMQGVIFAANKPGGFTENDIRFAEVYAGQAAVVIQNIRLLETERTLAEKLAVLYAIATATTQAANEDQLIEHVTLIIGQRLYSDSFGILLLDETTHELYLHSSYRIGSHEGLSRVPLGVGVTGSVARSGKALRVDNVASSPEYLSLYPLTRSELCVPLKVEEKLLGVVNVESTKAAAFRTEDEELLTIIAGQLATAIQRLRTVQAEHFQTQQLERSNSLIRALSQVNTRAATAADLMGVLKTLGSELNKLGLRCAVALRDPRNQHLVLRYLSLPESLIKGIERIGKIKLQDFTIPMDSPAADAETPHRSCLVKDPLEMITSWVPDFPPKMANKVLRLIGVTATTSICDLPLVTEGKTMGTLWMWGEGVHENDLPTVSLFASQVAAALQKANLLTEVGRLAITDELTGIYNRRHFFEVAEKQFALAERNKHPLSALIVDLDHFKQVNDTYGHMVGDQVLHETARLMCAALRESDIIGRYGGEEFSILLPETATKAAVYVAERLVTQVSETQIETEGGKLTIHLSIGVTGLSKETPTLHALIVRADQAMYLAKRAGRNCVAVK
jgi:diguanylate cyclase (GGDEF)-like protein